MYNNEKTRKYVTLDNSADLKLGRTGQELNISDIAKDCSVAPNTIKSWISVLESSGIVFLLRPYSNNISKRVTKRPKLYFTDTVRPLSDNLIALSVWNV